MPSRDRAAYMRAYRLRRKLQARGFDTTEDTVLRIEAGGETTEYRAKDDAAMIVLLAERITILTQELRETGTHPMKTYERGPAHSFTEFRPVPKPTRRK